MISEASTGMTYRAPNFPPRRPARAPVPSDSHQRSDKFERRATGTRGQILFSDAMSQFNNEVVIRREDSHRLYEFLFFVHFHRDDYEQGGGTTAVPP
jgi:hypothetical protein